MSKQEHKPKQIHNTEACVGSRSQLGDYINTQDTFVHYYVMIVNTGGAPVSLSSASYTCDITCEVYFKKAVYGGGAIVLTTVEIDTHTHMHTNTHAYTYMCTHTYTCVRTHTYTCACTHAHTHTHTHTHPTHQHTN